ncbi:YaaA family protein [Microbacterium sp. SLBN-146]|uniref:YaaA family protein n=1 Tax=Microbacterium sp. SLBN-146 TaxID=2768457 RepID=UPI001153027F|nr:peroxide stress protein YaaA [Microbacterium sp. SLBN-146]TQJ32569.1 hypothetical protein FBY39_3080 [Microbacterium sp. SLBN-146]
MLILLPPSETKRPGGTSAPLDIDGLAYPSLAPARQRVVDALVELAHDVDAAARVLKLSERQRIEVADNAALRSSPTMPAVDRYTGVLYDALGADTLDSSARRWLGRHVAIHSAPLGPVSALDPLPAYRLGASTTLPGLQNPRRLWAAAVSHAIEQSGVRFVLDLRSEAYERLGPVPTSVASTYVRIVTETDDGTARALNHFNKHAKGALVRRLAIERPRVTSRRSFAEWARSADIRVADGAPGELQLFV